MSNTNQPKRLPRKYQLLASGLIILFALGASLFYNQQNQASLQPPAGEEQAMTGTYYADIVVKDYGTISLELNGDAAPITVGNFVTLARDGFYDGLTFHRIIAGFMMQGGDPKGDGTGGSESNIAGEFKQNGHENPLSHTRGCISMARAQHPDSASSQFFIVHEDSQFLDGQYAAFGYVTEGMDVVDAICGDAQPTDDNGTIPAEAQPVIESITIRQ